MIFMIKAISNLTNQNTMHTTDIQAPTPAGRPTIFSSTSRLGFSLRLATLLLMMVEVQSVKAEDYVFMYNEYFVGNGSTPTTNFVPNASIYSGTSGTKTIQNVDGYYIAYNTGSSTTQGNFNITIGTNGYVYLTDYTSYYLNMSNSAWRISNTTTNRATAYTVTTTQLPLGLSTIEINGNSGISTPGTFNYTHTNSQYSSTAYTQYEFSTLTYYSTNPANTASTTRPGTQTEITSGYTWSLSDNANGYATVDNSGYLTVTAIPASGNLTITLTCTVTYNNQTATATKSITLTQTGVNSNTQTVTLDDREDHDWSYYSDPDCPIRSLNPADIKITYYGNGQDANNMTNSSENGAEPTSFSLKATGVQVGPNDPANTFIYYKTLERTDGSTATSASAATGNLKYTTIPNPFQVRPSAGTASTTRTVYISWSCSNWTYNNFDAQVYFEYTNSNGEPTTSSTYKKNGNTTITALQGTTITVYARSSRTRNNYNPTITAKYDNNSGATIATVTSSTSNTNYSNSSGTVAALIDNSIMRGFYAWRIKSLSSGLTIVGHSVGDTVRAESPIQFQTTSAYNNTVEFEALWAQANVTSGSSNLSSPYSSSVTSAIERNFHVANSGDNASSYNQNYPHTVIGRLPSSTTASTTTIKGTFTAAADTKFEDIEITDAANQTWTAAGYNLIIGRGVSGTINYLRGTSGNLTNPKYHLRLESGTFNYFSFIRGYWTGASAYTDNGGTISGLLNIKATLGCDYDRALNTDGITDNLKITKCVIVGAQNTISDNANKQRENINVTVKSGKIGSDVTINSNDSYMADTYQIMYMSVTNSHTYVGRRNLVIEGGELSGVAGGIDAYFLGTGVTNNNVTGITTTGITSFYVRMSGGKIRGSVYGGAAKSPGSGDRRMTFTGGTINGWIGCGCNGTEDDGGKTYGASYLYFGGNAVCSADPSHDYTMNGTKGGYVFGAGKGYAGGTGTSGEMTYGTTLAVSDNAVIQRDIFGGGNYGYALESTNVFIGGNCSIGGDAFGGSNLKDGPNITINKKGGTIIGGLYGGSNEKGNVSSVTMNLSGGITNGGIYGGGYGPSSNSCNVTNNVNITMTDGTVLTGLYGGGNLRSVVGGSVTISVNGGQVGQVVNDATHTANIHGGGYGQNTSVSGNVTLTLGVDDCDNNAGATVYGDVYGGSALGSVNTNSSNTTNVTLNAGTVFGAIYGGGLGSSSIAAEVNGKVHVVVKGGSVLTTTDDPNGEAGSGSVFGCNNVNGTPSSDVTVDVYRTAEPEEGKYALHAVYGGGNQSAYSGTPVVTIHGCQNSIEYVYGGGNAAAVAGTNVTIWGGNKIGNVFGGGNGFSETNNHTNANQPHYNPGANITSDGTSVTIHGGTIGSVFGGSNQYGTINSSISVKVEPAKENGTDPCGDSFTLCPLNVEEVYGGGNQAPIKTSTGTWIVPSVTWDCDAVIGTLFGGAKAADYEGDITLNISKGKFTNVFGGNNLGGTITGNVTINMTGGQVGNLYGGCNQDGTITGSITINVEEAATQECNYLFQLGNVYGGGNLAAYTAPTTGNYTGNYPAVNIKNGTISGSVFGAGKGDPDATGDQIGLRGAITGNPVVSLGDANGSHKVIVTKNVYGGGDAAKVTGNTSVTYNDNNADSHVAMLFGGGNAASVSGTTYVGLTNGKVSSGIYGGCNDRGSVGAVTVELNGGKVGAAGDGNQADVYGGGFGANTSTTGNIGVTLGSTTVYGDIYGGSEKGAVNATNSTTTITINGNALHGTIYGGGKGSNEGSGITAVTNGNVLINYNTANTNLTGLYGGANINGDVKGDITMNVYANVGASGEGKSINIFGGGLGAKTTTKGNITVTIDKPSESGTSPTIFGNLYGGSALGQVGASGKTTKVDFKNGTLNDTIFGGGMGQISPAIAAEVTGSTTVTVSAGNIKGGVYGGCNYNGTVNGAITVNINGGTIGTDNTTRANVHGGGYGQLTTTGNNVAVTIGPSDNGTGPTIYGDVYGGSALGSINSNATTPAVNLNCTTIVTMRKGTVNGDIYGGGLGQKNGVNNANGNIEAKVWSPVTVNLNGGSVSTYTIGNDTFGGRVFGCNNLNGAPQNTVQVNATNGSASKVFGGGNQAAYSGTPDVNISGGTIGNVYGGGNEAGVGGGDVAISGGTISSGVYGGCNTSGVVGGNITVSLTGGTVGNSSNITDAHVVFGGGYGHGTSTTGDISVTLSGTGTTIYGNLYGGSALGSVNASNKATTITIGTNTIHGTIFGGGMGEGTADATRATTNGSVVINYNTANTSLTGLYGGANVNGSVVDNIEVNVNANVGTTGANNSRDIFGGGLGAATATSGNVTVNIGDNTNTSRPVIYGAVYGGSALGQVNATNKTTTVNILSGTLHGNVYGGGLGQTGDENVAKGQVNGSVVVNIGTGTISQSTGFVSSTTGFATIDGSVYGCNNTNGSPKGNVTVNIYKTAHDNTNAVDYTSDDATYAIANVFGGGRQANYTPTATTSRATVHVHGCDNTIEDLFGGGDAANAYGLVTIVDGGRFDRVFGGGNGEVTPANIGEGGTDLQIHGGKIKQLFGGSNKQGVISGDMRVSIDANGPCAEGSMYVDEFFCGNNEANIGTPEPNGSVNINATIGCGAIFGDVYGGCNLADIYGNVTLTIVGGEMNNVYGGSKGQPGTTDADAADINGDVTLNIFGGKINNDAFGGSNINGEIKGSIIVNMDWSRASSSCNNTDFLHVDNVYGASNLATYTPTDATGNYPEVNIMHGTVSGSVFGAGKGSSEDPNKGVVASNPKVTIGDAVAGHSAVVVGNVYGGGDNAAVSGYTTVTYNDNNTSSTVAKLFGGGNAADVTGTTNVTLTNGKVTGGIYGGCNESGSVGAVTITLDGGTIGNSSNITDANVVFGGGYGHSTSTTGNVTVHLVNTIVYGNLYGGSALGQVNGTSNTTNININGSNLHGTIFGGGMGEGTADATRATTNGSVVINYNTANTSLTGLYGGANVNGSVVDNIEVNVNANVGTTGANNSRDIFGGGLGAATATSGNVTVNIGDNTNTSRPVIYGAVYGGSALGQVNATNKTTTVNILSGTLHGNVYGGGLGQTGDENVAKGQVNGSVVVNIGTGTISQSTGFVSSTTGFATIDGSVYGCNNTNGSPKGNVTVNIYKTAHDNTNAVDYTSDDATYAIKEIFGGGNKAAYNPSASSNKATVHVYTCNNTVETIYGGGNAADATHVMLIIDGGRFDQIFGGGNGYSATGNHNDPNAANYNPGANITGSATTQIHGGHYNKIFGGSNQCGDVASASLTLDTESGCNELEVGESFGGANEAVITGNVITTLACTEESAAVIGSFYGGSNKADIVGNVTLNVYGGTYTNVFGGSKGISGGVAANITGDVTLNLYGGTIENAYGGSDANGNIGGKITVNVLNNGGDCPLSVNNIFGGGNLTPYTPIYAVGQGETRISPIVNVIHGTISKKNGTGGNVYGGGKGLSATVTSSPQVNIGYDAATMSTLLTGLTQDTDNYTSTTTSDGFLASVAGNIYGGGDEAPVAGSTVINLRKTNSTVAGSLFGGGNQASVGNAEVNVIGGSVSTGVYGGCNTSGTVGGNIYTYSYNSTTGVNTKATNPTAYDGTIVVNIKSDLGNNSASLIEGIYGGGKGQATKTTGNITVTVGDGSNPNIYSDIYGGSALGQVGASGKTAKVDFKNGTLNGTIYGGGMGQLSPAISAEVTGATNVTVSDGSITGGVYGGCNYNGTVNGAISVDINGGTIGVNGTTEDAVFGGGYGAATSTLGDISVTIGSNNPVIYGSIYGGSEMGAVNASNSTTTITVDGNAIHGTIYGGGKGSNEGNGTTAVTNGNVLIIYNTANSYLSGLYGGANINGNVKGNISVNVLADVGASGTGNSRRIFGGGLGANTETEGDITVTIGALTGSINPTIYGDIYGGSALGSVNNAATDVTTVHVLSGTINGNIYGGGLGDKATLGENHSDVAAKVYGVVIVNIGYVDDSGETPDYSGKATINGSVYGCNNTNGSPQNNVTVNVYKTSHNTTNAANYLEDNGTDGNPTYAIDQVFGGGNEADYSPASTSSRATVHVYNCDNTIRRVFGGGNAAAAYGVVTTIDGGRFDWVFGGGNGEHNLAANIGAGGTNLTVNCGVINYLFGGSNETGTISGPMLVAVNNTGGNDCAERIKNFFAGGNLAVIGAEGPGNGVDLSTTIACGTVFDAVYGGSNLADIYGNVTLTIMGGSIDTVYAGSKGVAAGDTKYPNGKAANIYGNSTLNIYAGAIGSAFGGSNINGNIFGTITVNMDWSQSDCSEKSIDNVFGASNLAIYEPTTPGNYPAVNIKHGTVSGSVFGAGNGDPGDPTKGIVKSNPVVTIGDTESNHAAIVSGNVYGGGNNAAVSGNTSVTYNDNNASSTVANLFGGGNAAGVSGTASVTLTSGKVLTGVYGGCNSSGTVGGAITLNINGGQVGTSTTNAYGIFGGGKGSSTRTGDAVSVTIGTSPTTQTYPTIYGDVYGGSAEGQVNDALAEITKVWLQKGIINGDLYGGGFGDNNANALVNGSVQVQVDGGTVNGKVFGANNANGTPLGTVTVTINGTDLPQYGYALDEVYGGGNMADYTPTNITPATVIVNGCNNSIGVVYGGGNAADVLGTDVTIWGGTIGQVFGGGHGNKNAQPNPTEANVVKREGNGGNVAVKIYGGTIGEVFGGSNSKGRIEGASTVTIEEHIDGSHPTPCTFAVTDVYGGGNQADGNAGTLNIGCGANITGNIYGGAKQANVNNDIHLVITGGTLHNVFGGNNKSGNIKGSIIVDIEKDNACNTWHVDTVYGGGNLAAYSVHGYNNDGTVKTTGDALYNDPVVNIKNGTVTANVFGGGFGESATVVGNPHVNLIGGTVTGKVFGGGEAAPVTGSPVVSATYGQAASVYGGGLGSTAIVTGNPSVTINQASGQTLTVTDVFGGGDAAAVTGNTTVTLTAGSVSRAFGGGNLAAITGSTSVTVQGATVGNVYGGGNEAGVTQTSTVSMTSGAVTAGLYGGCNTRGAITGAVSVSVTGGTVGTDATHTANVHGGGYGNETSTGDNVTVLINGSGVNIWGDVYGGSGFGNVNSDAQGANNTTNVTLTAGTIHGSLYGGGLGQKPGVNGAANNAPSYAALVNGAVNVTVNGGKVTGGVFGANNANGTPKGAIAVVINGTDTPASGQYALNAVYGGGNLANCEPAATVTINGTSSINDVFGGGNAASVPSTSVTVNGGNINRVFAGGNGETAAADVTGNTVALVHGGTIHQLFGGGNKQGTIGGTMSVTVDKQGNGTESIAEVYGGGNEAPSGPGAVYILCGAENIGDVYGGANNATITGDIVLNIEGGQISRVFGGNNNGGNISGSITVNINVPNTCNSFSLGNVYGGGNKASYTPTNRGSYPAVNIISGAITGNVFGAGLGSTAIVHSNPIVSVTGGSIGGNVFGGGDEGAVDGNTVVTINGGTVHTKVFGGGNEAGVSGNANVTLTTGTVGTVADGGIYGGCYNSGTIGGYTLVNVTGGTVGTSTYHANIHGGGYGRSTGVAGDVTVNIGAVNNGNYSGSATIYGDVYGGSALGNVNTIHTSNTNGAYNKTAVNLYRGTIDGNVYGGGLGDANTAALVYGDVDVVQYGAILIAGYTAGLPSSGMIFGCNNENGTPKGHVRVAVYQTTETTGQEFSSEANRATHVETDHTYAMAAVYGGGNHAAYVPDDLTNGSTEVFINGCDVVSIHSVYGGGNAASTPATDVKIMGAYEIEYVFGGGNGAGANNPGANVGYYAYPASVSGPDQIDDRTEYRYGSGVANTEIFGGRIHKVFGGSNTLGNVREATVAMLDESSDCKLELDGIYGGGKSAYMEGKAEIELGCIHGLEEIYGGAEQADVGSDIILTLTSGAYNKVYGGNNLGGRILGSITVNIEQTGCLPIEIGELYLGGNNAPYSVYGYNTDNSIIETGERQYDDPVVNLKSFKYIGTVFGGGEGSGAVLAGNPTVNVNVATGWVDGQYKGTGEQDANHIYHASPQTLDDDGVIGQIFGGGNAAKVIGNTTINIGTQDTVHMVSLKALKAKIEASNDGKVTMGGMQFELTQDGNSIVYKQQGDNTPVLLTMPIIQNVNGATITGNVYGGGNNADVTGSTHVIVGKEQQEVEPQQQGGGSPAPRRTEQEPAQNNNQQQPQQPQTNAATESQQTRSLNATRQ